MSDVAVRVEGLGKKYRLGANAQPYKTLRASLVDVAAAPLRAAARLTRRPTTEGEGGHRPEFWALKDVSFDVRQGEVLGIIGRNGAGKSTLLKLLSQITEPTEGTIKIKGRVASLLEVGTGFHPELTGRENVFLNGAILGMSRSDITRQFDAIVAFADVERFIDTPVKHYSSGMYLRLAFAVAAHLEPELLVVDEVLAVGDLSFQRKCMDTMHDVGTGGRTVIFVSHNMPAITRLCERTILLHQGSLKTEGPAHQVVATYLRSGLGTLAEQQWNDVSQCPGNDIVCLRRVRVRTAQGRTTDAIDIRAPLGIDIEYDVLKPGYVLEPNCHLHNEEGVCAFVSIDHDPEWKHKPRLAGHYVSTAWIPGNYLSEGTFIVTVAISTHDPFHVHLSQRDAVAFQVIDSLDGDSARGDFAGHMPGVVRPLLNWTTQFTRCGAANRTADRDVTAP